MGVKKLSRYGIAKMIDYASALNAVMYVITYLNLYIS
jgi:hypothetical protein